LLESLQKVILGKLARWLQRYYSQAKLAYYEVFAQENQGMELELKEVG
jgi:hypothetical protein